MNNKKIILFLKKLGIRYKDLDIYLEALTHPSYNNEFSYSKNYQRLEFLGDTIIQKVVTLFLFKNFPKANEGKMTLLRSRFVRQEALTKLAKDLNFTSYIRFGKSLKTISDKILEEVFEAFIGAIYVDKGDHEVERFLQSVLLGKIKSASKRNNKNPKTRLQECLQSESRDNITYEITKTSQGFRARVLHDKNLFGTGVGKTKKQAEVEAARMALKRLCGINETN